MRVSVFTHSHSDLFKSIFGLVDSCQIAYMMKQIRAEVAINIINIVILDLVSSFIVLSIQKPIRIKAATENIGVGYTFKMVWVNIGDIAMRL